MTEAVELDWAPIYILYGGDLWALSGNRLSKVVGFNGCTPDALLTISAETIPALARYSPQMAYPLIWLRRPLSMLHEAYHRELRLKLEGLAPCLERRDSMPCMRGAYGHSGSHLTVAGERWDTELDISETPTLVPPPLLPEPMRQMPVCAFCETSDGTVLCFDHEVRACADHFSTARLHVARLDRGGLVHCPETSAETARFEANAKREDQARYCEASGYRTMRDTAAPRPRVTDEEPIPLVGSTPRYEWP